jgi:copper(I)-binding protein
MPMAAGFVRIDNPCVQAVGIVGAESLSFGDVSLHESRLVDGVNQMREIAELPVPAKQSVQLKPGGLHLMLMQPETPLREGEQPVITLKLKDGRSLPVTFTVRRAAP